MFPIAQIRFARPTPDIDRLLRFYRDGLQLKIIGEFRDHAGYNGVMLGLPDATVHLEFTEQVDRKDYPAPTAEHLLVLYFTDAFVRDEYVSRLGLLGFLPVEPENPYWLLNGVTIEDPDGYRVVLVNKSGFSVG